jgi:hypothetical protein
MAVIKSTAHGQVITNPTEPVEIRHQRVTVRRTDDSFIDGRGQAANGIRGFNGCSGFRLENLDIRYCGTGAFLTQFDGGEVIGCQFDHMGAEGLQVGMGRRLVVEDCLSSHHTENDWDGPDLGTSADRSHGYYLECNGSNWGDDFGLLMRRCIGEKCDGMGLHLRGSFLTVEDSDFTDNHPGAPGGAGDVQLTSTRHVILRRCLLENGDSGLTLYAEPSACEDVTCEDTCIWNPDGSFATSVWSGVVLQVWGGVVCGRWDKKKPNFQPADVHYETATPAAQAALDAWLTAYRPEEPTEPPIEPPIDQSAYIAALEARLATIEAELTAAEPHLARALQEARG